MGPPKKGQPLFREGPRRRSPMPCSADPCAQHRANRCPHGWNLGPALSGRSAFPKSPPEKREVCFICIRFPGKIEIYPRVLDSNSKTRENNTHSFQQMEVFAFLRTQGKPTNPPFLVKGATGKPTTPFLITFSAQPKESPEVLDTSQLLVPKKTTGEELPAPSPFDRPHKCVLESRPRVRSPNDEGIVCSVNQSQRSWAAQNTKFLFVAPAHTKMRTHRRINPTRISPKMTGRTALNKHKPKTPMHCGISSFKQFLQEVVLPNLSRLANHMALRRDSNPTPPC